MPCVVVHSCANSSRRTIIRKFPLCLIPQFFSPYSEHSQCIAKFPVPWPPRGLPRPSPIPLEDDRAIADDGTNLAARRCGSVGLGGLACAFDLLDPFALAGA